MRLSEEKAAFIVKEIKALRQDSKVYLFGSRVDDRAKGGDIDILILSKKRLHFLERGALESGFWSKFGQQKIDLVSFTYKDNSPFKTIALQNALAL